MSVSGLFNIGTSALQAAYVQLQTTGNNIANADTPGYSRQRVELAPTSQYFSGAGFIGRGVDVITVARLYDRFLAARVQTGTAVAAGDAARASQLEQLENLIGSQSAGIGAALDDFRLALADVVNRPADGSARTVVLGRARALADRFQAMSSGIEEMGRGIEARLADGVERLNGLLQQVSSLNESIARSQGTGQPPNHLLDQRDALVGEINGLLQVTTTQNADGSINLFGGGGHGLVVGGSVARLATQPDPLDPTRSRLVLETSGAVVPMSAGLLGGGELGGLVRFRDEDLTAARNGLGRLAGAVAGAYNAAHALGVDATGAPGGDLFAVGAPSVSPATGNAGGAAFSVSVADPGQLAASDYQISWDGSQYTVTRLSDGRQTAVGAWPATIDGLEIDLDTSGGPPAAGDRFLVRSASTMAAGFTSLLSSTQRLATGLGAAPATGVGNGGDVGVSSFGVSTPGNPNLGASVTLAFDGAGSFSVTGAGTGDPTGLAYTPGMTISYNGWTMTLTGQPAAGDTVTVGAVADPAADNRNARALVELGDLGLVQGSRFTEAWAGMLADIGQRSQVAAGSAELSAAVLADARSALGSVSGVNLDEEAARLLQYQQSYQAAAKVIATAQAVFDTLLEIAN